MAAVIPIKTAAETALAEAFGALRGGLPGSPPIRALRETAFEAFASSGLPHRRVEEWKYTDLRVLMREAKPLAKAGGRVEEIGSIFAGTKATRVSIIDGAFAGTAGRLPAGVSIRPLAEALTAGDVAGLGTLTPPGGNAAVSLNAAFMTDGVVIEIAPGTTVKEPVHLAFAHSGPDQAVYVRCLIRVGAGASVTIAETYECPQGAANQTNAVIELFAGEGARISRVKAQQESYETLHLSTLMVDLAARAEFTSVTLTAGGAVTRNQIFVTYSGAGAHASLAGATLLGGRRHADTTLVMDHAKEGGVSRELFKAVIDGEARSVFQGKIIVRPGAQKTDGKMMNASLLLSDDGEVDAKPELEIFADDVVCAHGATCGALDEDLLFYLKARGIPDKEAERLLVQAFLGEAIELVEHQDLKNALNATIDRWLDHRE